MPSQAPSYYHWSIDKPCTTNQVYGFQLKDSMVKVNPDRKLGPFDYTRPFSNSGFFPQISNQGTMASCSTKPSRDSRSASTAESSNNNNMNKARFNINRGYIMGHVPVTKKIVRSSLPSGMILSRSSSAPAKVHEHQKRKGDEIYLWHTLAGNLVHVKNYHEENRENMF